jgi:hypothetical protein
MLLLSHAEAHPPTSFSEVFTLSLYKVTGNPIFGNKKAPLPSFDDRDAYIARFHSDLKVALPLSCPVTGTTRLAYSCSAKCSKVHFHKAGLDYFQPMIALSIKPFSFVYFSFSTLLQPGISPAYLIHYNVHSFYISLFKNQ